MDNEFTPQHVRAVIVYNNEAVDVGEKLDRIAGGVAALPLLGYFLAIIVVTLLVHVIHHW
jgi:hypothetical protein